MGPTTRQRSGTTTTGGLRATARPLRSQRRPRATGGTVATRTTTDRYGLVSHSSRNPESCAASDALLRHWRFAHGGTEPVLGEQVPEVFSSSAVLGNQTPEALNVSQQIARVRDQLEGLAVPSTTLYEAGGYGVEWPAPASAAWSRRQLSNGQLSNGNPGGCILCEIQRTHDDNLTVALPSQVS